RIASKTTPREIVSFQERFAPSNPVSVPLSSAPNVNRSPVSKGCSALLSACASFARVLSMTNCDSSRHRLYAVFVWIQAAKASDTGVASPTRVAVIDMFHLSTMFDQQNQPPGLTPTASDGPKYRPRRESVASEIF